MEEKPHTIDLFLFCSIQKNESLQLHFFVHSISDIHNYHIVILTILSVISVAGH